MEEAIVVSELAGCGCGCGCDDAEPAEEPTEEPTPAAVIGVCLLDRQSIFSNSLGTLASYNCLDGRTVQGFFSPGVTPPGIIRDPGPGVDFFGL